MSNEAELIEELRRKIRTLEKCLHGQSDDCLEMLAEKEAEIAEKKAASLNTNVKLIIEIPDDYKPEDGSAFDAVVSALEHFEIPATIQTHE